jgi:predicted dehydrogenase
MIEHVPNVLGLRVVAVQDANLGLAMQVAKRSNSPWHGQRFEDLLDAPSIDAVVISTPNALHVPQTQAALRAGKHVLVQKPLATSAADARAAVDLAAACGKVLFVDYSYRLLDSVAALRSALPAIGSLEAVSAAFHNVHGPGQGREWFTDPKVSGGGALVDLGVHLLDLLLWVIRPHEARVAGSVLDCPPGALVEHRARMDVRLDQVPVTLAVSWHARRPLTEISVTIDGAAGRLRLNNVDGSFLHFQTWLDGRLLVEHETSLRENTLRAFAATLGGAPAPPIDTRVYDLLDHAYQRS